MVNNCKLAEGRALEVCRGQIPMFGANFVPGAIKFDQKMNCFTCYSLPFTRKIHPQVEPLLASYYNRCSYFMIDS